MFEEWRTKDKLALDHWRWMYLENPVRSSNIVIAEKNGEIVSVCHDLIIELKIGNNIVKAFYGTDVGTHPDHRRKGLYAQLYKMRENARSEESMEYGYTTNPIVDAYIKKQVSDRLPLYQFPYLIGKFIRINNVDSHLKHRSVKNSLLMKLGYKALKLINYITHKSERERSYDFNIKRIARFDENADTLWRKVSYHHNFMLKRNSTYLNWRYFGDESQAYNVFMAECEGEALGYIVYKIDEQLPEYPRSYIIDLVALPGRLDVADALIGYTLKNLSEQRVNVIECLITYGHSYQNLLMKNGFVNRMEPIQINYNPPSIDKGEIQAIKNSPADKIHVTYSDLFVL